MINRNLASQKILVYRIFLFFIIILGLALRFFTIRQNFFYFTMDQGRDAVYVRDILHGHQTLNGPAASIEGIYTGAGWYYLLAIGFWLFNGHPIAGPMALILINTTAIIFLALTLKKNLKLDKQQSIYNLLLTALIFLSPAFFETSLYAFNPFLLSSLVLIIGLLLASTSQQKIWPFCLASFLVGCSVHSQIAFVPPLIFSWLISKIYSFKQKILTFEKSLPSLLFLLIPFTPHWLSEMQNNFPQLKAGLTAFQSSEGVAIKADQKLTHLINIGQIFIKLAGNAIFPLSSAIGISILFSAGIILLFYKLKKKPFTVIITKPFSSFEKKFIIFTIYLWLGSLVWLTPTPYSASVV